MCMHQMRSRPGRQPSSSSMAAAAQVQVTTPPCTRRPCGPPPSRARSGRRVAVVLQRLVLASTCGGCSGRCPPSVPLAPLPGPCSGAAPGRGVSPPGGLPVLHALNSAAAPQQQQRVLHVLNSTAAPRWERAAQRKQSRGQQPVHLRCRGGEPRGAPPPLSHGAAMHAEHAVLFLRRGPGLYMYILTVAVVLTSAVLPDGSAE